METTIPVKYPTIAPTIARCRTVILICRAPSQWRVGIMMIKNRAMAISTRRDGRISNVRAPSAAAGTPVIEYAAQAR